MPTIKQEMVGFNGGQFKRVVKCDSTGLFTCNVPPAVTAMLGMEGVSGKSLNDVLGKYGEVTKRFNDARTTTRKVILFKVQSNAYVQRGERVVLNTREISFTDGLAVSVAAWPFIETEVHEATGGRYTYEAVEQKDTALPPSVQVGSHGLRPYRGERATNLLVWSPEHEQFFCKLAEAMERIVLSLETLKEPEQIAQIVALGDRFLLGNSAPEK